MILLDSRSTTPEMNAVPDKLPSMHLPSSWIDMNDKATILENYSHRWYKNVTICMQ